MDLYQPNKKYAVKPSVEENTYTHRNVHFNDTYHAKYYDSALPHAILRYCQPD